MAGFVAWIKAFAISLGGPGLFVIAFLDSSFLSFPEVNDLLIIWLTTQHKERMIYYALMTTLGSVSGCLALYALARKGGEAFLLKRFNPQYVERAMTTFRRYGLLAILVPSILPPPTPFKIFVLAAGVAKVRPGRLHTGDRHRSRVSVFRRGPARGLLRRSGGGLPATERQNGRAGHRPGGRRRRRRLDPLAAPKRPPSGLTIGPKGLYNQSFISYQCSRTSRSSFR